MIDIFDGKDDVAFSMRAYAPWHAPPRHARATTTPAFTLSAHFAIWSIAIVSLTWYFAWYLSPLRAFHHHIFMSLRDQKPCQLISFDAEEKMAEMLLGWMWEATIFESCAESCSSRVLLRDFMIVLFRQHIPRASAVFRRLFHCFAKYHFTSDEAWIYFSSSTARYAVRLPKCSALRVPPRLVCLMIMRKLRPNKYFRCALWHASPAPAVTRYRSCLYFSAHISDDTPAFATEKYAACLRADYFINTSWLGNVGFACITLLGLYLNF